jgi:serine/threonine-protein kinase HipA
LKIRVQTHLDGAWRDAAEVEILSPERGIASPARTSYEVDYWADLASVDGMTGPVRDRRAVSVTQPVVVDTYTTSGWPAWLLDLMPQGAARTRIAREEGFRPDDPAVEPRLLIRAGGCPVGNVRIRDAWAAEQERIHGLFCPPLRDEDLEGRTETFLDVVDRFSLIASGSSGVQGEWPKALMTRSGRDGFWYPDPFVPSDEGAEHVIIKLLKSGSDADRLILEAEAPYLELARSFGLRTGAPLRYRPGVLILPRFDRSVTPEGVLLHGQESLISAMGVSGFGVSRTHEAYLQVISAYSDDPAADRLEYLMRDVLNLACGNPDNHGRNTALSRPSSGGIRLSPLFDFAPMRLSDAGIARQSRWSGLDGTDPDGDWGRVCEAVACDGLSAEEVRSALIAKLPLLRSVRDVAARHGVNPEVIRRAISPERVIAAIERLERSPCPSIAP